MESFKDAFALARPADADEPATAEQLAAVEFEPFPPEDIAKMVRDFSTPHWEEECRQHGQALRIACVLLGQTKKRIADGIEAMESKFTGDGLGPTAEFFACLDHARNRLTQLAELLGSAAARQSCAAAVVELRHTAPLDGDAGEEV